MLCALSRCDKIMVWEFRPLEGLGYWCCRMLRVTTQLEVELLRHVNARYGTAPVGQMAKIDVNLYSHPQAKRNIRLFDNIGTQREGANTNEDEILGRFFPPRTSTGQSRTFCD